MNNPLDDITLKVKLDFHLLLKIKDADVKFRRWKRFYAGIREKLVSGHSVEVGHIDELEAALDLKLVKLHRCIVDEEKVDQWIEATIADLDSVKEEHVREGVGLTDEMKQIGAEILNSGSLLLEKAEYLMKSFPMELEQYLEAVQWLREFKETVQSITEMVEQEGVLEEEMEQLTHEHIAGLLGTLKKGDRIHVLTKKNVSEDVSFLRTEQNLVYTSAGPVPVDWIVLIEKI